MRSLNLDFPSDLMIEQIDIYELPSEARAAVIHAEREITTGD